VKVFNFPQYSPEWWAIREKKITASHAQAIGTNGKGLVTYVRKLMSEYFSTAELETYSNKNMATGLELESDAAVTYSWEYTQPLQEVGFVVYNDFVGCSPDRFVGDNGLAEIKCPTDKVYFDLLLDGKIESKYVWQMQMQMLICERDWCDYVVYNPNFDQSLFVKRTFPDSKKVTALKEGFAAGEKLIKEIVCNVLQQMVR